jgi:ubiquitin-conjugating enzyme E2 variant
MSTEPPTRADLGHYSPTARRVDTLSILGFFVAVAYNGLRVGTLGTLAFDAVTLTAAGLGYLAADVASGTVHWFFDTWLRASTPVLGSMFVRPFREHHVDPLAITRHDFVETNGSNCLGTLPVLLAAAGVDPAAGAVERGGVVFAMALALGIFATNQLHKWAHLPEAPPAVRWLHRTGLVLGPAHHARHHQPPYARNYCITTGWMNPVLDGIGFFRGLERTISALTGAVPRAEDGALG